MTDGGFNIADLAASADDELVFDDEPIAAIVASPPPSVELEPARPRRTPRRGRTSVEAEPSAAPVDAQHGPGEPHDSPPASGAADPAATEEPAGSPAPVPQPDVGPAGFDRRNAMLMAIVALALFSSLLSLGGLIAVGRTLAHAEADRARAAEQGSALARVPAIVKSLDDATNKLALAASHTPGGPPATVTDVRQALDDLRVALAAHQPDGLTPLTGMTRDGFTEIGSRLDRLSAQMGGRPVPRAAVVPAQHE